jgi:hypothetical protein
MSHSISFLVSEIFCHNNKDSITLKNRVDRLRPCTKSVLEQKIMIIVFKCLTEKRQKTLSWILHANENVMKKWERRGGNNNGGSQPQKLFKGNKLR